MPKSDKKSPRSRALTTPALAVSAEARQGGRETSNNVADTVVLYLKDGTSPGA